MKKKILLLCLLGLFSDCTSKHSKSLTNYTNDSEKRINTTSIRKLATDDEYLDLDMNKYEKERIHSNNENGIIKAITYRFYKNVQLKNGLYVCNVKSYGEINVTKRVFGFLLKNLDKTNNYLIEAKRKGKKVDPEPLDDKYFNALLK